MSKLNKILLVLVIVLLIALGVVLYWQRGGFKESYWAVYLDTGDIYFGKLHRFPRLSLTDIYFLQRNPDNQQNPLSLSKFARAFWGPEDKIYLNEKNIVWETKLSENSQVLQFIKNASAIQFQQPLQQPSQQPPEQSTTTQQ